MATTKILVFCVILTAIISCNRRGRGDNIVNTVTDVHLANKLAENDFNKGLYWVQQENYTAAEKLFLKADQESPHTPVILNAIGNCLDRLGKRPEGFAYYEKALQIDSTFIRTYINYGASLNNARHFDDAERILRLGLQRRPLSSFDRGNLYCNLAYSYDNSNRHDTALRLLDSAKAGLTHGPLYDAIVKYETEITRENIAP
jgi:tetratricopeptide (TPR) repeat protein